MKIGSRGGGPRDTSNPAPSEFADGVARTVPQIAIAGHRVNRSPMFSESSFAQLLVSERKRADRSNRPFILLSVKAKERLDPETSEVGKAICAALLATTRETDVVGWLKWPTTIGVVFLEIGPTEPGTAVEAIRARVHRELQRRIDVWTSHDFALEFHVYPESKGNGSTAEPPSIDPLFHPDLVRGRRQRNLTDWIKRAVDVVTSGTLLFALSPLLLAVAALVKLTSPGPALFRQRRLGELGKPFTVLKFRTMRVEAAPDRHYEFVTRFIKDSHGMQANGNGQLFKLTGDPRITPLGRVLRKTSIDELPQLWNVLTGDMSLVGPRPPIPYEAAHYASWHRRRVLEAKPGITGLWQVMGRSRTTFDDMVRLDLRYARTRSVWTDLWILLRTPRAVVSGDGAC